MKLVLRELKQDIEFIRKFAQVNATNEIGQKINKILDYTESKLNEEDNK